MGVAVIRPTAFLPRWIVAVVVLTMALPICCCNGNLLLRALNLAGPQAEQANRLAPSSGQSRCDHEDHHCCGSPKNGESAPHDKQEPCRCGQHDVVKKLPEQGTAIAFAPATFALYEVASVDAAFPSGPESGSPNTPKSVPRPPTSLLRLHCALTI